MIFQKEPWQPVDEADNGFVEITVGVAAVSLGTIPLNAVGAQINVEADLSSPNMNRIMKYRDDGGAPTSTLGNVAADLAIITLINKAQVDNFRAISMDGLDHKINVQFFYNTQTT